MELRLLGPLARPEGGSWRALDPTKPHLLLAYLAYHDDWVARSHLAYLFWPDVGEDQARTNLRQLLARLRQMEWLSGLETNTNQLRWRASTDVGLFRDAVEHGELATAVKVYRAPLLDAPLPEGPFEEWAQAEREELERVHRHVTLAYTTALQAEGRHAEAADLLHLVLRRDPLAEDVLQAFLLNASLAGDRAAALAAFEQFAASLKDDLGLEPLEETRELVRSLREDAPPSVPRSRSAPPAGTARKEARTALVGRAAEAREVTSAATPVVVLSGEPGIGKTALAKDVAAGAVLVPMLEGLQNLPYGALLEHVRQRAPPSSPSSPATWADLLPELAAEPSHQPEDPDLAKFRLFDALAGHLRSRAQPDARFTLLLDDLQWADKLTLEWLAFLASTRRFRVLATFRQGEVGPALAELLNDLEANALGTVVRLGPLQPEDVTALLRNLSAGGEVAAAVSAGLHVASGGNPFFLLQLVETLVEAGALAREPGGRVRLANLSSVPDLPHVPVKVAALVRRRVDHLGDAVKRVLETASVVRTGFDASTLSPLVGLSESATDQALAAAERAGILGESRFRHDLFREVLYGSVPSMHRRFLHRKVADALEDTQALMAAEHWWQAGEPQRAIAGWIEGARMFNRHGLLHESIEVLERAVVYVPDLRLTRAWLAQMYLHTARFADAEAVADDLLSRGGGATALLWGRFTLADLALRQGRSREALEHATQGLELVPRVPDEHRPPGHVAVFATILTVNGEHERALELVEPNLASSDGLESAYAHMARGFALLHQRRYEEAYSSFLTAWQGARALGARHLQVHVAAFLAAVADQVDRTEEVIDLAERALELGRFQYTPLLLTHLAQLHLSEGRYEAAHDIARSVTDTHADHNFTGLAWALLVEASAELGQDPSTAVETMLAQLERTDFPNTRARILTVALTYGTEDQRSRAARHAAGLPTDHVLERYREPFLAALADFHGGHAGVTPREAE